MASTANVKSKSSPIVKKVKSHVKTAEPKLSLGQESQVPSHNTPPTSSVIKVLKDQYVGFSGINHEVADCSPLPSPFAVYRIIYCGHKTHKKHQRSSLKPVFYLSFPGHCRNAAMQHGGLRERGPAPYVNIKGSFLCNKNTDILIFIGFLLMIIPFLSSQFC